ncbi:MAG: hypothetical protein NXI03_10250 [Alphaproteobacteria bacterium]|nr:hypothetical protein [Alphaproteobacteria bacterium]
MDDDDQVAKLLKQRADMLRKATEMTAESAIGTRVLKLLEAGSEIGVPALIASFQAEIDGYKGDKPEQNVAVMQARAVIDKLQSASGSG